MYIWFQCTSTYLVVHEVHKDVFEDVHRVLYVFDVPEKEITLDAHVEGE